MERRQLSASKNYTAAVSYLDKALSQEPTYIDSWIHKRDTQKAMKDYNGSISSYSAALKLDKNKTAAWSGIVDDYTALQELCQRIRRGREGHAAGQQELQLAHRRKPASDAGNVQ